MANKLTKCLNDAINIINEKSDLDPEMREQIVSDLRRIARDTTRTDEQRIVSVELAARNKARDIVEAAKSFKRQEAAFQEIVDDPRFTFDKGDFDSVRDATLSFRRNLSPESGNRGIVRRADPKKQAELENIQDAPVVNKLRFELFQLQGKLDPVIRFTSDIRTMADSENALAFHQEMVGMDSGNAKAKEMVKVFRDSVTPYLDRLREAGVWVDEIDDWFPQTHDLFTIQSDIKGWRNFLRQHLDTENHPDPEATIDALLHSLIGRENTDATGGRIGMRRKIFMDTPEAQHEYFLKYGDGAGNVSSNIVQSINKITSETVLAEEFAPNPMAVIKRAHKHFADAAVEAGGVNTRRTNKVLRSLDRSQDAIQSLARPPTNAQNQAPENWVRSFANYMAFSKLGKVFISEIGEDQVLGVLFARSGAGSYWRAFTDRVMDLANAADSKGALSQLAETNGIRQHAFFMQTVARNPMEPGSVSGTIRPDRPLNERVRGKSNKLPAITQRYTGAMALENGNRTASFGGFHRGMVRHADQTWQELSGTRFRRELLEDMGVTPRDWEVIRNADRDPETGFIDVEKLKKKNFPVFRKYMTAAVREAEIRTTRPDAESIMLVSGLADRLGDRIPRQIVTQFLAWPQAVLRNGMMREIRAGAVPGSVAVGSSLAVAAATVQLYQIAAGNPPFEWDSKTLWSRSLTRSAFMGPWVPMAADTFLGGLDTLAGVGPGASESLPGVLPGTVSNLGSNVVKGVGSAWDEDYDKTKVEGIKFGKQLLPNWWMVDAAISKGTDSMIFSLDPAALRRRNRRWEKEGRVDQ